MSGRIAGIVLAGGRSNRMGGHDKAMMMLAGKTLLDRAVAKLESQVDVLAVNSNADPASLLVAPLQIIADTIPGYAGPLAGLLAGFEWAATQNADHLATVACDTPFFPGDLVERLAEAREGIALASSNSRVHPVFGLWQTRLVDDLRVYLATDARRSVLAFAERHQYAQVDFDLLDGGVDPFFNTNTPQDFDEAEQIARKFVL